MLSALRDFATDEVIAVHRRFLTEDARKDGKAMMLGPCAETAIKLSSHGETFPNDRHFTPQLHVVEGVETGIGALMLGFRPVWALGSSGAIARMEPLLSVGQLVVLADNDDAGIKAARQAMRVWRDAGWSADYVSPEIQGEDYADVVKALVSS
jgi:hypothetical protein